MTLDLVKLSTHVKSMGNTLQDRGIRYPGWVAHGRRQLRALSRDWQELKAVASQSNRRLATPLGPLDKRRALPDLPHAYRTIATDGSQIEPDRHGNADYYLLNVGWAVIQYGIGAAAELASEASLYFEPEDLYIVHGERRVPVQDRHLSARRACREMAKAADLAATPGTVGVPTVVLADGTLQVWVLADQPDNFLRDALLVPYLDEMKRVRDTGVPLASYMSRPRHSEVTGLLREATCKRDEDPCDACAGTLREQCIFERITDRALFEDLDLGERSALFQATLAPELERYYREQIPCFFYVNVGSELARVEVPSWTADNPDWLDLIQAVVFDQCRKGLGYPNALARAHEQAVVSSADRKAFAYFLDGMLARLGVPHRSSEKQISKRLRAV